ncbi:MAG: hypothetical protein ABI925_09690 [Verrucomicrobiota bacterium]
MTLRFDMDFVPSWLERRVVKQTKEDVKQRLQGHGPGFLRILLKRRKPGRFAFQFFGEAETVEAAKRLLGIS